MKNIKTKIIATIGPSISSDDDVIRALDNGVNIFRVNCSHGNPKEVKEKLEQLNRLRDTSHIFAIMIDTKGPEMRVGDIEEPISLKINDQITLGLIDGDEKPTIHSDDINHITNNVIGKDILFDDGMITAVVVDQAESVLTIRINQPGVLKSHKSFNIPGFLSNQTILSEHDLAILSELNHSQYDMIAVSFVRGVNDLDDVKDYYQNHKKSPLIISKIENILALDNIDAIIDASDGVMVARGDLGVEVAYEKVPFIQKKIVNKCLKKWTPSIVATQMLESMINKPIPTRAEVSDVAFAVDMGASAVMLSGESAVGLYPHKTIQIMKDIIIEAEKHMDFSHLSVKNITSVTRPFIDKCRSLIQLCNQHEAKWMIIIGDNEGFYQTIQSLKSPINIMVVCKAQIAKRLCLNWGLSLFLCDDESTSVDSMLNHLTKNAPHYHGSVCVVHIKTLLIDDTQSVSFVGL
jgi:pyruvate kinase